MAKVALAVAGGAIGGALGFFLGPAGVALGVKIGETISAASLGLSVGTSVGNLLFRPKLPLPPLQDLNVSSSANGAPIPFGYGTVRLAGQLIWCPGIQFTAKTTGGGGGGSGGGNNTAYTYYANLAVAFGEGPASLGRVWADSKIIYDPTGAFASAGGLNPADYPAWDSTALYNPGAFVSYLSQVWECVRVNRGQVPYVNSVYWALAGDYPQWQSGVSYNQGDIVSYFGQLYVCIVSHPGGPPPGNSNWRLLSQYYKTPTFYPGDEFQTPDPLIQGSEGANVTPAFRGICYAVWENLPLLNFGNRIPNMRAELTYLKVKNVL
jgi:hypothetical protein